jgi:hypothetical protein
MKIALVGAELEENLALRYLHAAAANAGHDARILDFHAPEQTPDVVRAIAEYAPQVVGLSMVFTARAREFVHLAEELRRAGFAGHLVASGHFASFHARELLTDSAAFDSVVVCRRSERLVRPSSRCSTAISVAAEHIGVNTARPGGAVLSTHLRHRLDGLLLNALDVQDPLGAPCQNSRSSPTLRRTGISLAKTAEMEIIRLHGVGVWNGQTPLWAVT